jgi:hypothetical protein
MTRNIAFLLGAAVLTFMPVAPAFAQSAAQQSAQPNGTIAAPNTIVKKSGRAATDIGQTQTPGFSQLTEQECRNLGGAVHTAPQCKTTQQRCVIRLAGGQINAPCIDEIK